MAFGSALRLDELTSVCRCSITASGAGGRVSSFWMSGFVPVGRDSSLIATVMTFASWNWNRLSGEQKVGATQTSITSIFISVSFHYFHYLPHKHIDTIIQAIHSQESQIGYNKQGKYSVCMCSPIKDGRVMKLM